MSKQEIFLEELKHPGFIGLLKASEKFLDKHGHFLTDLEIQIYTDRNKTYKIFVSADNNDILLITTAPFREFIKEYTGGAMVHIQSTPSVDKPTNIYSLAYYIELK